MPCEWDCAHSSGRAGWLRSHPPATLSCSPLPQHDPPPCAYSPSDSGRPSRQVGLRPAPAHSCAPASPFKVGRREERASAPYLRHRERLAVLQAPLQGEAPGRPPLQLHRDVLEGPRPVLHPRLGWPGAAGLLFRGGYRASAPSSSATIVLQLCAAPLRLLSRLETLRQLVSPRRK